MFDRIRNALLRRASNPAAIIRADRARAAKLGHARHDSEWKALRDATTARLREDYAAKQAAKDKAAPSA
ncbi:hypothetical protein CLG96_02025 [Sphingomonas oleivorans]|uniref:Uncharacterized protein n=1 Tax=Sphingomonas oleivorans TaxID=1735121 RepID=A0A2T5G1D4_9SPHN|nr:hypothetical protein [Sphingomonas oleivorans]PTQ12942.1 hypothetical protein CLG96_02025 [Sphingomonas oleivorans]